MIFYGCLRQSFSVGVRTKSASTSRRRARMDSQSNPKGRIDIIHSMKVIFLDRDGTLIHEPADGKIDSIEKLQLVPFVISSLKKLQENRYYFIIISNQPGLGTKAFAQETFNPPQQLLMKTFYENGITFEGVYFCPHYKEENCPCRKPKTGLIDSFLKKNSIELKKSFVIGDRESDILLVKNIGCRSIFYSKLSDSCADASFSNWNSIVKYILTGITD